jgi:hypothetical protein
MPLGFPFLLTVLVWGFGASMFALSPDGQSPVSKPGGLPSFTVNGGVSMRVLWRISAYKVVEGAVWGEEEARKMLFKPLDIDATKITFDDKTCRSVIFKQEKVNAKEYLDRVYHTTPQTLGIEDEIVEVVKTNCDLRGFAQYIRLSDKRLIIHLNGVFFYFEPVVNY